MDFTKAPPMYHIEVIKMYKSNFFYIQCHTIPVQRIQTHKGVASSLGVAANQSNEQLQTTRLTSTELRANATATSSIPALLPCFLPLASPSCSSLAFLAPRHGTSLPQSNISAFPIALLAEFSPTFLSSSSSTLPMRRASHTRSSKSGRRVTPPNHATAVVRVSALVGTPSTMRTHLSPKIAPTFFRPFFFEDKWWVRVAMGGQVDVWKIE